MQYVIAVPAVPDEIERVRQGQRCCVQARHHQRATAQDHRRAFRILQRISRFCGKVGHERRIIAQPSDRIGQIDFGADREHRRTGLDRLADSRVDQRRFPARIGADQQDCICRFDPRDRRVEVYRGKIARIVIHAGLAALDQLGAQVFEQFLRCIKHFDFNQIAPDCGDLAARFLGRISDCGKGFAPACFFKCPVLAHPGRIETVLVKTIHSMAGLVARPFLIHIFIDAREGAEHFPAPAV